MEIPTQKYHWLASGYVVVETKEGIIQRGFNTLLVTDELRIDRNDLAKTQQAMQMRFLKETVQIRGNKVVDVFINGFTLLGHMTPEEFNSGFSALSDDKAASKEELN